MGSSIVASHAAKASLANSYRTAVRSVHRLVSQPRDQHLRRLYCFHFRLRRQTFPQCLKDDHRAVDCLVHHYGCEQFRFR